ncbi:hypothetical protein MP638_005219 [Amoeboaphelidium occidentale]|nr:hypothetical protein MP638_005219 [Amoeboaphelidium occidentale]
MAPTVLQALYDYSAEDGDELSFTSHSYFVSLPDSLDEGWLKVRPISLESEQQEHPSTEGIVPKNYVIQLPSLESTILYDYDKQSPEELHVKEGQKVTVYLPLYEDREELVQSVDEIGWVLAYSNTEQIFGLVASSYLSISSSNTAGESAVQNDNYQESQEWLHVDQAMLEAAEQAVSFDNLNSPTSEEMPSAPVHFRTTDLKSAQNSVDNVAAERDESKTLLFPVTLIYTPKTGSKKTVKSKEGILRLGSSNISFVNASDGTVIQQWTYSDVSNYGVNGNKKKCVLELEFKGIEAMYTFKFGSLSSDATTEAVGEILKAGTKGGNAASTIDKYHYVSVKAKSRASKSRDNLESSAGMKKSLSREISGPVHGSLVKLSSSNDVSTLEKTVGMSLPEGKAEGKLKMNVPTEMLLKRPAPALPQRVTSKPAEPATAPAGFDGDGMFWGKAIASYTPQQDDELEFYEGDIIVIKNIIDENWFSGYLRDDTSKVGFIPANYVEQISMSPIRETSAPPKRAKPPVPVRREAPEPVASQPAPAKPPRISNVSAITAVSDAISSAPPKPPRPQSNSSMSRETSPVAEVAPSLPSRPALPVQESRPKENPVAEESIPSLPSRPVLSETHQKALKKESEPSSRPVSVANVAVPTELREWADKTGTFKVEAKFVGFNEKEDKVLLIKKNNVKIGVPFDKLSLSDLEFLFQETKNAKVKVALDKAQIKSPGKKSRSLEQSPVEEPPKKGNPPLDPIKGYDWNAYLTKCGIDSVSARQYAQTFEKEKMGHDAIEGFNRDLLKSLGVAEGHIIKILKFSNRLSSDPVPPAETRGSRIEATAENKFEFKPIAPVIAPAVVSTPKVSSASSKTDDFKPDEKVVAKEKELEKKNLEFLDSIFAKKMSVSSSTSTPNLVVNNDPFASGTSSETKREFERIKQLEEDERLARKLQEEENKRAGRSQTPNIPRVSAVNSEAVRKSSLPASFTASTLPTSATPTAQNDTKWEPFGAGNDPFSTSFGNTSSAASLPRVSTGTATVRRRQNKSGTKDLVDPEAIFQAAKVSTNNESSSALWDEAFSSNTTAQPVRASSMTNIVPQQRPPVQNTHSVTMSTPPIQQNTFRPHQPVQQRPSLPPVSSTPPLIPIPATVVPLPVNVSNGDGMIVNNPTNPSGPSSIFPPQNNIGFAALQQQQQPPVTQQLNSGFTSQQGSSFGFSTQGQQQVNNVRPNLSQQQSAPVFSQSNVGMGNQSFNSGIKPQPQQQMFNPPIQPNQQQPPFQPSFNPQQYNTPMQNQPNQFGFQPQQPMMNPMMQQPQFPQMQFPSFPNQPGMAPFPGQPQMVFPNQQQQQPQQPPQQFQRPPTGSSQQYGGSWR